MAFALFPQTLNVSCPIPLCFPLWIEFPPQTSISLPSFTYIFINLQYQPEVSHCTSKPKLSLHSIILRKLPQVPLRLLSALLLLNFFFVIKTWKFHKTKFPWSCWEISINFWTFSAFLFIPIHHISLLPHPYFIFKNIDIVKVNKNLKKKD